MKTILLLLGALVITARLHAQNNAPVRLAIVSESPDTTAAADLLTTAFSKDDKVALLERAEIDKVIREQQLSVNNLDRLKLGQLLGADGLLALQSGMEGTQHFLNVQLVAVKPGVILADERFVPPTQDAATWAANIVSQLEPMLPKLGVLPQDAIPLSVVNFHAGVRTEAEAEMERRILFLTIERLVRERRLFILERRRMQTLFEEKELAGTAEEPFWNGKYVLDGAIDQDGFNPDVVTINARLIPPGGQPILIEAEGSRTNCVEAVNQLAESILKALKIDQKSAPWDTKDEAEKYFQEAQWDLSWGLRPQAQAAADSAWALGKNDQDCAELRVTAYMRMLPEFIPPNFGSFSNGKPGLHFMHLSDPPDPKNIDYAIHSLQIYDDFCRTSLQGRLEDNSKWYYLGMENLALASGILQQFCLSAKAQTEVADKLAQLRYWARLTAEIVLASPSVREKYYPNAGTVAALNFDDAGRSYLPLWDFSEIKIPNILECAVLWGCFWQERPEDTVALYRKLMTSPQFFANQSGFLFRDSNYPRLAAWNAEDAKHISGVWQRFMDEMAASTNCLLRLEAKAITCADARTRAWAGKNAGEAGIDQVVNTNREWKAARQTLLDFISTNYDAIVGTNHQVQWGMQSLLGKNSKYMDQFAAIRQRDLERAREAANLEAFAGQKRYLTANNSFNSRDALHEFQQLFIFGFKDHSKAQAAELQPLLAAFKSNLLAQAESLPAAEQGWARIGIMQVGQVEAGIDRILSPVAQPPAPIAKPGQNPARSANPTPNNGIPPFALAGGPPTRSMQPASQADTPAPEPLVSSNVVIVKTFYPLPVDDLPDKDTSEFAFVDHQLCEGQLILDFQVLSMYAFKPSYAGVALFDLTSRRWRVLVLPGSLAHKNANGFAHHTAFWHGAIYTSNGGTIQRFDMHQGTWDTNALPVQGNCQLFNLDRNLYVADYNSIQQITDDGRGTKLLASIQRQPPVTSLDSQGALRNLVLFMDARESLCAAVHNKIFRWDGGDWREIAKAPASFPASVFNAGVLFQTDGWNTRPAQIFCMDSGNEKVELCLRQQDRSGMNSATSLSNDSLMPLWKLPAEMSLPNLSAALWRSDLFLMADHSEKQDIMKEERGTRPDGTSEVNYVGAGEKFLSKDGYDTALYCFSRGQTAALKILMKFESATGCPPMAGLAASAQPMIPQLGGTKSWMLCTSNLLVCGREQLGSVGGFGSSGSQPANFAPGIWTIPISELEAAIARQKPAQPVQRQANQLNQVRSR